MAVSLNLGSPKSKDPRKKALNFFVTENEYKKTSLAEKFQITKTDVIMRGIDLLANPTRKIVTRSQIQSKPKKTVRKVLLVIDSNDDEDI